MIYSVQEAGRRLEGYRKKKADLKADTEKIQAQLDSMPDVDAVLSRAKLEWRLTQEFMSSWSRFEDMSWGDKRRMLQLLFTDPDHEGRRSGIYLWKDNRNADEPWYYEIRGTLGGNPVFDVDRLRGTKVSKVAASNTRLLRALGNAEDGVPSAFPAGKQNGEIFPEIICIR